MKYAIFPLNLFILPGERTYLHIFEPRYKELLKDVEKLNMPFGIYYECDENLTSYGTMVNLIEVIKRYPGGELDIQIEGDYLFHLDSLSSEFNNKLYSRGVISRLAHKANRELNEESFKEIAELVKLRDTDKLVEIPRFMWDAVAELNLSSKDKYELARLETFENQQSLLRSHIQLRKAIMEQELNQNFNIYLN